MNSLGEYSLKHPKLVDVFLFKETSNQQMEIVIIKNFLLLENSKEAIHILAASIESTYDTYDWLICNKGELPVYINNQHYKDISEPSLWKPCVMSPNSYSFDILVTDMCTEYSLAKIITDKTFNALCRSDAVTKVRNWIEKEFSEFKELEWYIYDKGKIHVFIIDYHSETKKII